MIGPFGRHGPAATLRQHCTQMTRKPGNYFLFNYKRHTHEKSKDKFIIYELPIKQYQNLSSLHSGYPVHFAVRSPPPLSAATATARDTGLEEGRESHATDGIPQLSRRQQGKAEERAALHCGAEGIFAAKEEEPVWGRPAGPPGWLP